MTNAEGAAIVFGWQMAENQCVLASLDVSKGGAMERVVTFGYSAGPGLISEARYGSDGGGPVVTYEPSLTQWTKSENGVQTSHHNFSGVATDYGQGDVALFSKISATGGTYSWNHLVPLMGSNSRTPLTLAIQLTTPVSLPNCTRSRGIDTDRRM